MLRTALHWRPESTLSTHVPTSVAVVAADSEGGGVVLFGGDVAVGGSECDDVSVAGGVVVAELC